MLICYWIYKKHPRDVYVCVARFIYNTMSHAGLSVVENTAAFKNNSALKLYNRTSVLQNKRQMHSAHREDFHTIDTGREDVFRNLSELLKSCGKVMSEAKLQLKVQIEGNQNNSSATLPKTIKQILRPSETLNSTQTTQYFP